MFSIIIIVALLVCLVAVFFVRPNCKKKLLSVKEVAGAQAENAVSSTLKNCCVQDGRCFEIFQNVYIPKSDGKGTTEIDILLIHESGFYVFESKNIYGKLYGYLDSPEWTCYYGRKTQKFCNPIIQNSSHILHLEKLMALAEGLFKSYNIVVFGKNTQVIKIPKNTELFRIYDIYSLRASFLRFVEEQPSIYGAQEVNGFCSKLSKYANASEKIKQQHMECLKAKEK